MESGARVSKKCKLLPYTREDVLTIQEAKQKAGWEITAFNLPKTWEFTQGEGVTVAVLDSGIDFFHNDLKNNIVKGKNFIKNEEPIDILGHGSAVSGIIAATNDDIGIVGVAPLAKIMPVKVLDDRGNGKMENVALGTRWAVDNGADLICMSLGSPNPVQQVYKAIQYAEKHNVVTFCASGNAGITREIFYPASYLNTIGVGSCGENFERADFSCTGDDLDFLAPGVNILTTVPQNWYAMMSGTSFSSPFVVGIAALLLSYKRKTKSKIKLKNSEDYRNIFKKNTISVKNPEYAGKKFFEGFGIIDPNKFEEWLKS